MSDEDVAQPDDSSIERRDINWCLEDNPASDELISPPPSEYREGSTKANLPIGYPEMDFRKLSKLTNTKHLTHTIHKHPAIFIPHIPNYIINRFTENVNADGDRPLILDPFSGSGTSGVEAKVSGRDYLGIEINPLSKLVSEVATDPIPPTVLENEAANFEEILDSIPKDHYPEQDISIEGRTSKTHWFEQDAIEALTTIRKALSKFSESRNSIDYDLTDQELAAIIDADLSNEEILYRVERWLVLMVANTVFDVSNADPGVSKAYKSPTMKEKIENGDHPPDGISTYLQYVQDTKGMLIDLWNTIYGTEFEGGLTDPESLIMRESGVSLTNNQKHKAETDIRLGDARTFDFPKYRESVDLALTSPPYINAMNYYRGTKLRLFWIHDLIEDRFDGEDLRRSIVGTNSAQISETDRELPAQMKEIWGGNEAEFQKTVLPELDEDIREIHQGTLSEAKRRAFTTWKFFAKDMLGVLEQTYLHLKPGAFFFFIIGENTIGGRTIKSHKYVADIAQNLGKFEQTSEEIPEDAGYRLAGFSWDEISNRDLFHGRDHGSGMIECEWVVVLQKKRA